MDIDRSNEEEFFSFINREIRATLQIAPFIDLINFTYGDLKNYIIELNLQVGITEDQILSNINLRERVNRDFDLVAMHSTIIELANFAFGDYQSAVDAFNG